MREHMEAEEKLRQAQKMEAIGRLTGGIAHDFNNLLTVVIGSAETLADGLGDSPELASIARMALDAAERGAELVSRLLAFARTQPLAPQPVDCARFLEALEPILRRTLANNIEVAVEAPGGELCCLADLTQLTSAVLNLCINGRDAMPDGGNLRVRVSQEGEMGGEAPAFVVLSVEDTGGGMSDQTRARALEPFFTTKPVGKGSGLGLSMVHCFVSQSGGRLEIDTEVGRGTSVRLYLPQTASAPEPMVTEAAADLPAQSRRILLVEDDDLLRGQVARQLALLGCEVSAHGNGHEALERLEAGAPVDLLMTDLAMPGGLNGRQLADRARALNPALRILFTSGHTDEPTVRALCRDGRAGFLAKPYRRAELGRRIAEVFGDQPTRASASAIV
jgi:CheY-like chemotaxis protein/two-component sensor histidine kinase